MPLHGAWQGLADGPPGCRRLTLVGRSTAKRCSRPLPAGTERPPPCCPPCCCCCSATTSAWSTPRRSAWSCTARRSASASRCEAVAAASPQPSRTLCVCTGGLARGCAADLPPLWLHYSAARPPPPSPRLPSPHKCAHTRPARTPAPQRFAAVQRRPQAPPVPCGHKLVKGGPVVLGALLPAAAAAAARRRRQGRR